MRTGWRSGYWIIEWSDGSDASLEEITKLYPEIVLDRHVAIASCDSGPYKPTTEETAQGWKTAGDLAISPRVTAASILPTSHFDEWYVYDRDFDLGVHKAFVNFGGFGPLDEADERTEAFWTQLDQLQPIHVVGAGFPFSFW
ncbi:MAG: hypothetical protein ACRYGG_06870 [Janthinobacterium lividum]